MDIASYYGIVSYAVGVSLILSIAGIKTGRRFFHLFNNRHAARHADQIVENGDDEVPSDEDEEGHVEDVQTPTQPIEKSSLSDNNKDFTVSLPLHTPYSVPLIALGSDKPQSVNLIREDISTAQAAAAATATSTSAASRLESSMIIETPEHINASEDVGDAREDLSFSEPSDSTSTVPVIFSPLSVNSVLQSEFDSSLQPAINTSSVQPTVLDSSRTIIAAKASTPSLVFPVSSESSVLSSAAAKHPVPILSLEPISIDPEPIKSVSADVVEKDKVIQYNQEVKMARSRIRSLAKNLKYR